MYPWRRESFSLKRFVSAAQWSHAECLKFAAAPNGQNCGTCLKLAVSACFAVIERQFTNFFDTPLRSPLSRKILQISAARSLQTRDFSQFFAGEKEAKASEPVLSGRTNRE